MREDIGVPVYFNAIRIMIVNQAVMLAYFWNPAVWLVAAISVLALAGGAAISFQQPNQGSSLKRLLVVTTCITGTPWWTRVGSAAATIQLAAVCVVLAVPSFQTAPWNTEIFLALVLIWISGGAVVWIGLKSQSDQLRCILGASLLAMQTTATVSALQSQGWVLCCRFIPTTGEIDGIVVGLISIALWILVLKGLDAQSIERRAHFVPNMLLSLVVLSVIGLTWTICFLECGVSTLISSRFSLELMLTDPVVLSIPVTVPCIAQNTLSKHNAR